ncbi:hypothetical protein KOW79_022319 [Hemibagrus wyckioides]|uniref:STRA6-like n=1 Tax=Hemibagrus wyckioides TaxID=337641 RepID=A0A9D3N032_9TELE|nr:hypothetical protein KOW79_022319 [Hemibagrus wyckioides]
MDPQFINFTKPVEELENVFILLLLMFVERRQKICSFEKRFPCLSGRFGIMVPLDFTSSLENRWSYAFAFGAITPLIFSLFFGDINPFPYAPRYLKVFVYLVAALEVGVVCKPFFACLSTPNQMLGGILGLLYTLNWDFQPGNQVMCLVLVPNPACKFLAKWQGPYTLLDLPHLLCLGFLMVLIEQVLTSFAFSLLDGMWDGFLFLFDQSDFIYHLNYFKYTWYVSAACATFSSVIHIGRVLVCYRKHIKSMWTGKKTYLPRKYKPSPTASLGGLLKYPSYQIAFTLWGYLITHLAMFVGGLVFVYMVISPIRTNGFLPWLTDLIIVLANFFVVLAVMGLQRMFLHIFFLQDKNSPTDKDKPLALNNRKVFNNVNYFLFFFNLILGLMSCMMRLMKSSAVGLMLLSCIERAIMPQGFETLDKSYCTWVGMIITDHHHSNPVLLTFCHLMLHHTLRHVRVDETSLIKPERPGRERARTRWFLMYTLVRNPKLILMRKQAEQSKTDSAFAFAWAVSNTP